MGEKEILSALLSSSDLGRGRVGVDSPAHTLEQTSDPRIGLVCVTAGLVSFGLVMILSVAPAGRGSVLPVLAIKQVISALVGTAALLAVRKIGYHRLARMRWLVFAVALFALMLVLVPHVGARMNGARRWFRLGFFSIQPSEFAKIALVLFLADFLSRRRDEAKRFYRGFLPACGAIGIMCLLIQAEPDFGNAILTGLVGLGMLVVAGIRMLYLVAVAGLMLPALWLGVMSAPYRIQRLITFLDPWADPQGAGYHTVQSLIAVGSGGFFGVGPGRSAQKLHYLPSAYSDFVFAIVAEETGHLGCLVIVGLFVAFLWYGMRICRESRDDLGFFVAFGLVSSVIVQGLINIAVVTACVPTKGLPLPFVSFGGSNLVSSMIAVGILLSVADSARGSKKVAGES